MQCWRCGSDHVELATLIVERETQYTSGYTWRGDYVEGHYVPTRYKSRSARAEALTADEPKQATWWTTLIAVGLIAVVLVSCCAAGLATMESTSSHDYMSGAIVFFVVLWVIVLVTSVVGGALIRRQRRRAYTRWYQNTLARRYYCHNCAAIIQN